MDEAAQVPEEFRPACGRPGSRVVVRHFPVTIPHALCDGRAAPAGRAAPVRRSASALAAMRLDFTGTLREVLEVLTAGLLARKR